MLQNKLINTEYIKLNKMKDKFNGIQVTNFHNKSTEVYARSQSIKQPSNQARRPEFYKYIDCFRSSQYRKPSKILPLYPRYAFFSKRLPINRPKLGYQVRGTGEGSYLPI